ncbi:hypothetical protein DV738_g3497, partial [Chaetothyriales sp. CBS 135597]
MAKELKQCSLEPAYIIEMFVTAANPVGEIANGSTFIHYEFSVGSMSTVDSYTGTHVEGQIVNAGDWMWIDPSKEHASVKVKGIVRTLNNASLYFSWTGHAFIDEDKSEPDQQGPGLPFGELTTLNRFEAGDPSLKELSSACFVGIGRYILRNGQIGVELGIARVVPLSEM